MENHRSNRFPNDTSFTCVSNVATTRLPNTVSGEDNCNCSKNSSVSVNSPPNLVRCTYNLSPRAQDSCSCSSLQATAIVCQKCACQEVRVNAHTPTGDDPCFTRIPKRAKCRECDQEDHGCPLSSSSTMSRKKMIMRAHNGCAPYCGYVSEYQEEFRKRHPGAGAKIRRRPLQSLERPAWNSSITVPSKPYQETLEAAEAKLKALDMFQDPSLDIMALAIIRDQVKERYRATRIGGGGGMRGDSCCAEAVSLLRGGSLHHTTERFGPCRPTALVKGSKLELVEQESLLSDI